MKEEGEGGRGRGDEGWGRVAAEEKLE